MHITWWLLWALVPLIFLYIEKYEADIPTWGFWLWFFIVVQALIATAIVSIFVALNNF